MLTTSRRALATIAAAAVATTLGVPAGADAKTSKGHKKKPVAAKVTKKHKAAVRKFVRSTDYDGPTGTIVHVKSRTVDPSLQDGPRTTDAYVEIGGGQRYFGTDTYTERDPQTSQSWWGAPTWWAVLDPAAQPKTRPVVHLGYVDPAQSVGMTQYEWQHIPDAQANADAAPAGPTINGRATRAVHLPGPFEAKTAAQGFTIGDTTVYLDAVTKAPLRIVDRLGMSPDFALGTSTQDISLWQVMPAGTSDSVLSRKIPLDAVID